MQTFGFGKLRHKRLVLSVALGLLAILLLPHSWVSHSSGRFIVAWNIGAALYLFLIARMSNRSLPKDIQRFSSQQDEGRLALLMGATLAAIVCLAAITVELATVKTMSGWQRPAHIALATLTIVTSWAVTHVMFALHYAHEYYRKRTDTTESGLLFPGVHQPNYVDFIYFSFVIGTSGQTADVAFTSTRMRKLGIVHCVVSFIFNTTILALTVNVAASILTG